MKKTMKKLLAVLISLCLLISTVAVTGSGVVTDTDTDSSVVNNKHTGSDIPVIYLTGTGGWIHEFHEDGTTTKVFPVDISTEQITALVEENIDVFAQAFFTQEWGEFCDVLYEIVTELYGKFALDEKGNPRNNSGITWKWNPNTLGDRRNKYGNYDIQTYTFQYDWRLDPYRIADDLHRYIEDVMAATGATEVALVGRCLGVNITAAYMDKYNAEHVSDYIAYSGAHNGADIVGKIFSGQMNLEADGIERFLYDENLLGADTLYNDLLNSFVTIFNKTYGLDIACWAVNNVYEDIYLDIVPRILIETYATLPGYWSMVSVEDYELAKEVVFHGADKDKYADFIKIIDNYHYNVTAEMEEDFKRYEEMGVNIFNVTKYGYQATPISDKEYNRTLSDGIVSVELSSDGATSAPVGKTFNKRYIEAAKTAGTDKYISPDKQIDASTALFPERTWFVKNIKHAEFPRSMDLLFGEMIRNDNYTVNSDPDYPQYMVYEKDTGSILPMTVENTDTESWSNVTFFDALKKFFKSLFELIKQAINEKTNTPA